MHGLTGAYALDALTSPERDRFEHHLHRCPPCQNEVRGFAETAARLAVAMAATPPLQLRPRVLAAVATTRQLPPEAADVPLRRAARGRAAWFPRLATAVAGAGVAAAIALGVTLSATQDQLDQARARNQAAAAVLAAPDARLAARSGRDGGTATVVASWSRHALIITTAGLPALRDGRVYELWFMASGRIRAAGLLPAQAGGRTAPLLASGLAPGDKVALTVEPAGGTKQPTTQPIVVVPLRA
jgi:hypothetical protein